MNLHLVIDGREIELWQTPSFVTAMCLIDDSGKPHHELKGKKAKAAVIRYLEWVRNHASGAFPSIDEASDAREIVMEHITKVLSALRRYNQIIVYAS